MRDSPAETRSSIFFFEVDTVSGHRQLNLWVCTVYSSNDINQIRSDHCRHR